MSNSAIHKRFAKSSRVLAGIFITLTLVAVLVTWRLLGGQAELLPSAKVQSGEFLIDLKETGRLKAENSLTVSAPPIRITLQVVDLVPEGTVVEKGDFLIQFDTTEIIQRIDDVQAELDIQSANMARSLASMKSQMASLESQLESSRASYRLAELRLEQMKFEANVRIEEGKLQLLQAHLSLKQAEDKVAAQIQIDSADVRSLQLKIRQAEIDLDKANVELKKLRVYAPGPGLVIFKDVWRGGEMSKLKVGDTPWRGMALIELPDLSVMMVETTVNEVDVAKVKIGLRVEIKLDAYPDPTYHGEVVELGNVARTDENSSDAKIFDVLIRLDESDQFIKPGMSAAAKIIIDRIPGKTWVPIEAVSEDEEDKIVYVRYGRKWKRRVVELGVRNENFVVIESGVQADEIVALVDPVLKTDKSQNRSLEENNAKGGKSNSDQATGRRPERRRSAGRN